MKTTTNFDFIYKNNYSAILKFIDNRVNHDKMVAEELTNDVFIKANEHLKIFNPELAQLTTWLHTIAKNVIIDHYRKIKQQNQSIDVDNAMELPSNNATSNGIEGKELMLSINTAINLLRSKQQREVFNLYYLNNKKYEEIAEILDISMSNVKVTLLRAKECLQKSLVNVYQREFA